MAKVIFFFVLLVFPALSLAAGIVPCDPKVVDGKMVNECGFCEFGQLIKNGFDWFVLVSGVFVVLTIVVAGLWMGTAVGNVSAKTGARKIISTAIVGYMILLASWMIVDTFLKLIIPGSEYGVWNALMCS
ncbi:MAG: hypothetical protein R3B53_02630 [Candidatus Paceibacterota bacterium]